MGQEPTPRKSIPNPPLPRGLEEKHLQWGSQHSPHTLGKTRRHLVTVLTLKSGKFLLKKHRTAILFRRISRFLLAQMLNIPLVSGEETPDSSQNLSLMVAPLLRGQGWQWWVGLGLHG